MKCENIKGLLSSYMDGMLNDEEKRMIEEHIRHCVSCSRELKELKYLNNILDSLEELEVPERFTADLQISDHLSLGLWFSGFGFLHNVFRK